jgi:hypothetical protein
VNIVKVTYQPYNASLLVCDSQRVTVRGLFKGSYFLRSALRNRDERTIRMEMTVEDVSTSFP